MKIKTYFNIFFFCPECYNRKKENKIHRYNLCLVYDSNQNARVWTSLDTILTGEKDDIFLTPHVFREVEIDLNAHDKNKAVRFSRLCGVCGLRTEVIKGELKYFVNDSKEVLDYTSLKKWENLYLKNQLILNR